MSNVVEVRVALPPDDSVALKDGGSAVDLANVITVDSAEMAQLAIGYAGQWKVAAKSLAARRDKLVNPIKEALAEAKEIYDPTIKGLEEAAKLVTNKAHQWQMLENERIRKENAEREAAARAERDRIAREAAAQTARLDAEAKLRQQQADEAARAAAAAMSAGDEQKAFDAAAEAAAARHDAESASTQATQVALSAASQVGALGEAVREAAPVIAGLGQRRVWEPHQTMTDTEAIIAIAVAIASGRRELAAYLTLNMKDIRRAATSQRDLMSIPGFAARQVVQAVNKA